jgi:hypothetical protein
MLMRRGSVSCVGAVNARTRVHPFNPDLNGYNNNGKPFMGKIRTNSLWGEALVRPESKAKLLKTGSKNRQFQQIYVAPSSSSLIL